MTKIIFYLLLFVLAIPSYGQATDTIFLKEIQVSRVHHKTKHLKSKGMTSSLSGKALKGILNKMDDIPTGSLASVKLYFNSRVLFFVENDKKKDSKDVNFGLLVYDVKEDGSPGKAITDKEIRFTVTADHKGAIELDLTPLHLNTLSSMYIGIELLQPQVGNDFTLMISCSDSKPNSLYMNSWNADAWSAFNIGSTTSCGLKMDLGIQLPIQE